MTLYIIRNKVTGLYRIDGQWGEEPELYTWAAAKNICESSWIRDCEILPRNVEQSELPD